MPLLPSFRKGGSTTGDGTKDSDPTSGVGGLLHTSGSDLRGLLATTTSAAGGVPHIEIAPPPGGDLGDSGDMPGPLPMALGGLAPPQRHHRHLLGKLRSSSITTNNNHMRTSQSEVVLSTFLAQQQSLLRSHSGVGNGGAKFGSRLQVPGGGLLMATPSSASSSTSGSFRSRGSYVRSLLPNLGMPRCRLSHPGQPSRSMLGLFSGGPGTTANSQSRCSMAPSMGSSYSAASFRAHCKLCLSDIPMYNMFELKLCKCTFCKDCVEQYIKIQILDGNVKLYCPDGECSIKGLIADEEIQQCTEIDLFKKYQRYKLNTEVDLDENRAWCPTAGCETICEIDSSAGNPKRVATPFLCTTCELTYCSACKNAWQPNHHCKVYKKKKTAWFLGSHDRILFSDGDDCPIKHCPNCQVPIERDNGCAQMMCKRCKHVFCWYCLASLDDDFLLRHYDKGPCKNKLGHSRASVVWHRTQVIGIFAGFGVLLLVASPLLLLAAPCILCCKCKSCERCSEPEPETAATAVNL